MRFIDFYGVKLLAKLQDCWRFVQPFEPLTHEFIVSHAKEGDIFLDVGAHVGIYAVKLARKVSKVIALEPEPQNYGFLYRNILVNGLGDKIIALPVAA